MDEKHTTPAPDAEPAAPTAPQPVDWADTWVTDMKQDLEDYLEEQGIYIRQ